MGERLRTVYVARDGAVIRKEGARLRVFSRRELVEELPTHGLDQLVLMGNITLTPAALALLVDAGIDTVLLSHHGRYRGRLMSGISSNVRLRLTQYQRLTDPSYVLETARTIVAAKARNQRAFLMRHARRHGETPAVKKAQISIKATLARLTLAETCDEVRGCEGAAAAAYFRAFGSLIRGSGFTFEGRSRRPPMDPVNALLSLGYTLLFNVVEAAVHVVGLDPYLGALHAPESGRPSLACDLVEELRAVVVDSLVVAALNQGAFKVTDFELPTPGEPVFLPRDTTRWLVTLFERRLDRKTRYEPLDKELRWRDVIEQQARAFARALLEETAYAPLTIR